LSKHISGHPFTINACNYNGKTYVGGLSYQYTGIPELTSVRAATVGNDWQIPAELLSPEQVKQISALTIKVGHYLQENHGYRGLFGLDMVVEFHSGKIYLVEINPRQTASI